MLENLIIQHTLRVPVADGPPGDSGTVARQLDATLLKAGFKASLPLLEHISGLAQGVATARAELVVEAVSELVGDHVEHNSYFLGFPHDVPETLDFWVQCVHDALDSGGKLPPGLVNLLALPKYGRYQHTYAELLAAHDELIPSVKDRLTIVHLGGPLADEAHELYLSLAGRPTPLGDTGLTLLDHLARYCVDAEQPESIPVRENRAVVNAGRLDAGHAPLADTVTDVLRLACALSGGDLTLQTVTRFQTFKRPVRRVLMAALEQVVAANPAKLGDVARYARPWQRLGERLHPHEYPALPHAQDVFAVARGEKTVRSLAGRVEIAFAAGEFGHAVELLAKAPGTLMRSLDRVVRSCPPGELDRVLDTVSTVSGDVSGRVLCSVREHLLNRATPDTARVFVNSEKRAWAASDERPPLAPSAIEQLGAVLDAELARRLPAFDDLVIDPGVLDLAVPLSGKADASGFGVMPRGSLARVHGSALRFFTYWKQAQRRTDFDLSVLLLDDEFKDAGQLSWTSLKGFGGVHSGDITEAPEGATEFIDLDLNRVTARYLVPQVNVYDGEGFDHVEESLFGFMTRDGEQRGAPFDPRTVHLRSEMRGSGRVALPLAFVRDDDGGWHAKWLHLYLSGTPRFNAVETNRTATALLTRALLERAYLPVSHLVNLLRAKANTSSLYRWDREFTGPVTFLGLSRPENLPEGSRMLGITELIPL
ncbi:TerD family protein [Amycolatopsis sp. H20-H5]|uniref:TerD family protein n=1 Tax=Amycolatopsis sp. H20-H5 TaxID=3046309 RepID=UPI002DBAF9B6|nr:TerD family protein [Amycolatopsis sp. H20-H5]MEC3978071.1 TerD family protein [Amycolatopsis sp. H20-H5]